LALANIFGTLAVLPGLARKKLKATSEVPFGPWLILATFVSVLVGHWVVSWLGTNLFLI
jgi:prepilin signal peptidase PulO-like enzyme (type II secretory pathway)